MLKANIPLPQLYSGSINSFPGFDRQSIDETEPVNGSGVTIHSPTVSARGASALSALHLPPSLPSPSDISPRLWAWVNGPDGRVAPLSSAVIKTFSDQNNASTSSGLFSLGLASGGSLEKARDVAVFKRANGETSFFGTDATLHAVPDHLAVFGGVSATPDCTSLASFNSKAMSRSTKQRKPVVESPPPLPPRKNTLSQGIRPVTHVLPSIPRLFVQLVDLRIKNSSQAFNVHCTIQVGTQVFFTGPLPLSQESRKGFGLVICPREGFLFDIPSIDPPSPYPILIQIHKGAPPPNTVLSSLQTTRQKPISVSATQPKPSKHRRKKSNDSVAHSIASISSTFSSFKTGLMRGLRGERGATQGGGQVDSTTAPPSRRRTLNISSPFRGKMQTENLVAPATVNATPSKSLTAPAAEPVYTIPCYHGPTVIPKSDSIQNLLQFTQDESSDAPSIPESLVGQVVLIPSLSGDAKATFEKVVYMVEQDVSYGLAGLKLGGMKKGEKEVAIVGVQVGMVMDEGYPLVVEIPPVEYSTFLNIQLASRGGGQIWKKYWAVIKEGIMHVFDFEYKESKPMISSLPLQSHLLKISRPDPEEMCASHCLKLDFTESFDDEDIISENEMRWREAAVEVGGVVYVTAESKERMMELEDVLIEFL
ncbi:hypothetical protein HDU98_009110 [Podochytrium sp. JEL0797]|nr:hypothetical protein HDU98_009110 [Podochytrium sp. JEL0797]